MSILMLATLEPKPAPPSTPPPQYRNPAIERKIANNKDSVELKLIHQSLTVNDMEIVAYYALRNNKVNHIVLFIIFRK
jgi:hypothetical protein